MLKRSMSRRDFLRLSAAGAAGMAGTFGGLSPILRAAALQQALSGRVEVWGFTGTIDHFQAAEERLESENPGFDMVTQSFSYLEAHTNITNALVSGVGVPDLVNFDVAYMGDFADGLSDLTELFAPYADQFVPIAVKLASAGGRLLGLPQDNQPMGLAYRADIFEQYGITEDDLATWEGFVEAGKKLWTDSGETIKMIAMDAPGSQMAVLGAPHQVHEVFFHLAGYHGVFFNRDDDKVIVDEPDAVAAIEVFKTICDPAVSWISQTTDSSLAAYQSGLVATNICPAWWPLGLTSTLAEQTGKWRIMRLPALKEGGLRAAFQVPSCTGIPALAANPESAWGVLVEAQLTPEAQMRFYEISGGILPTNIEVVNELATREIDYFGGQKIYALFNEILEDIPDVWFGRGWVEARTILTSGIEPIMRGEIGVEDGLRKAAEDMRRSLNKG
jgi:ABC-type glycerol-3-phosphate transport system substrate-binding protein